MSKFETLMNRVHELAHEGKLDRDGVMTIAPTLGIKRASVDEPIYGEIFESDTAYFGRIHTNLSSPEGLEEVEAHYENLAPEGRRAIGRAIKAAVQERPVSEE